MPDTKDNRSNQSKIVPHGEMNKRRETQQKRRKRFLVAVIAVIAAVLLIIFFAKGGYEKILDLFGIERSIAVTPVITQIDCEIKGEPKAGGINGTTVIYDEQGVTGYDSAGKWKWNEACSFVNPVVSYLNNSVVFTDVGGTTAYAFNENGLVWRYGSENKIFSIFGSTSTGYICILHEEKDYISAVSVYENKKKSSELTELFTRKFGSHYMLAGAVSGDGKQLSVTGVYSKSGDAEGVASFIRMSDGEIFSNEVFDSGVYVKSFYADDGKMFLINSDSIRVLYHTMTTGSKGDINKEIWNRQNGQNMLIDAVLVNGKYCVAAFGTDAADKTVVKGYDTAGKESLNFEVAGNIIGMQSVGDTILLYTNKYVYLYSERGLLIGTQEAGFTIQGAVCTDSRHVAVYGDGKAISVSFK